MAAISVKVPSAPSRSFPNAGAPGGSPEDYLPPGAGVMGPMFAMSPNPTTRGPGKSILTEHLGTVVGKRGAGLTSIGGGDSGAHALGQYGKGMAGRRRVVGGQFGGVF